MRLRITYFCLAFITSISCAFLDIGELKLTEETAPLGTLQSGYYYSASNHWISGAAAVTDTITQVVTFSYNAGANPPTSSSTTPASPNEYTKYLDIFDISGGTTSRSYKNGPFVIFGITAPTTCDGSGYPSFINFNIRFFCNDTDAAAFYAQMHTAAADVNFWVNSANTAVSVPAAAVVGGGATAVTFNAILLGDNTNPCT